MEVPVKPRDELEMAQVRPRFLPVAVTLLEDKRHGA